MSYNTVESVLLCCAVLVCLSGIMFNSVPVTLTDHNYQTERRTLTYAILILVGFSLAYITFVMFLEINSKMNFFGTKNNLMFDRVFSPKNMKGNRLTSQNDNCFQIAHLKSNIHLRISKSRTAQSRRGHDIT